MVKRVEITPEIRAVLERGEWDNAYLFCLPREKLDWKLYQAVDKVLRALGGKWNRSARMHLFDRDARQAFDAAMASGGVVDQKRTLEQFFTPPDLARRMAGLALDGMGPSVRVLEPSAGGGALIEAALAAGAASVVAIELDDQLAERLTADGRVSVLRADFLTVPVLSVTPDAVIMNPPFSGNKDIAHVRRAFDMLCPGGRLVAIMSPHFTFAEDRASREFRELIGYEAPRGRQDERYLCGGGDPVEDCTVELLPAGAFKAEGTNVAAVLVTIEKAR